MTKLLADEDIPAPVIAACASEALTSWLLPKPRRVPRTPLCLLQQPSNSACY